MKTDEYLKMCRKVDPIFLYSKANNFIKMSIEAPDCGDFFVNKETM